MKIIIFTFLVLPAIALAQLSTIPDALTVSQPPAQFTTLLSILRETNLIEVLHDAGPFTLFAPTDLAFGKMDPLERERLLGSFEMKTNLMKRLIIKNRLSVEQLKQGIIDTLGGEKLNIIVSGDGIHVAFGRNMALVVSPELLASNGIVIPIDTVLS